MTRKSGLNANQTRPRRIRATRQRPCDTKAPKASLFEDLTADRGERAGLDALLPYLNERVALKMPSDIKLLDGVLDFLNDRLLKLGIIGPDDSEVLIALDEAIVNAIKHGNKCDPRKVVHITAEFDSDGAQFTIRDEGEGFAREKVPDPTDPCRLLEPNGRGLLLINHIMDTVCYNKSGNEIQMFKRSMTSARSLAQSLEGRHDDPEN
jgi:serine/threonine-protein kinase RsbW